MRCDGTAVVAADATPLIGGSSRAISPVLCQRIVAVLIACAAFAGSAYRWLPAWLESPLPFVAPLDVYALFVDSTAVSLTVYAGGEYAPWRSTVDAIRTDRTLWRRMHLENFNSVPPDLRAEGLDALLEANRAVMTNPRLWDKMSVRDWDLVPQPVRTVAYRQMVAYWTGLYDVGGRYGIPPALVSDTVAAIIMSESWLDHRAIHRDRSGNVDIGLAQASGFARARLRELYNQGVVDVDFTTEDYFNPWSATRFVALWFSLLLDEAAGDLDLAVRAYNRGIANAFDDRGSAYLAAVKRRLHRFIRNNEAPDAWAYVWHAARTIEQDEWPWMSFGHTVSARALSQVCSLGSLLQETASHERGERSLTYAPIESN